MLAKCKWVKLLAGGVSYHRYDGKPVRDHSLQAAMIADMAIAIESPRALYPSVAAMFNDRERFGSPGDDFLLGGASASKVHACDVTEMDLNRGMEFLGAHPSSSATAAANSHRDRPPHSRQQDRHVAVEEVTHRGAQCGIRAVRQSVPSRVSLSRRYSRSTTAWL